jgi:hypothetical protein
MHPERLSFRGPATQSAQADFVTFQPRFPTARDKSLPPLSRRPVPRRFTASFPTTADPSSPLPCILPLSIPWKDLAACACPCG